ncbi:hypothetical protein Ahy_B04g071673 [Arachis hypogaea]|uniref:Uncharacterized protein n=1 Tax=Arachis hypogaea TaxID=3818 RepID=A0A444ZL89_ARAHY|nr:hypothetical protein Ahy_B04g071673 [Arachis hypogaea]
MLWSLTWLLVVGRVLRVLKLSHSRPHRSTTPSLMNSANKDDNEGYSTYVAKSGSSSDTASEDEYVSETPTSGVGRFLLPPPLAIPRLSNEVWKFGGAHICLAPTMSQDHAQLDSGLICKVVLPMNKTDLSVSIFMFASELPFQSLYRKVWMAKQKSIVKIAGKSRTTEYLRSYKLCMSASPRASVFSVEELEPVDGWLQT